MLFTMNFKQGDIVLVEVIFSERSGSKKRPALVISNKNYHKNREKMIIAAITSNIERILVGDTPVKHWKESGLKYASTVTGILQTIKQKMITAKIGRLTTDDLRLVKKNLNDILL